MVRLTFSSEREKLRAVCRVIKYSHVLEAFAAVDRISTAAKLTGFSRNTVSKIVREFAELDLLKRDGAKLTPKGYDILKEIRRLDEILSLPPRTPAGGGGMSVVISASVKIKNCSPQLLAEAAEILGRRFEVGVQGNHLVIRDEYSRVVVYAEGRELKAVADSSSVSQERLSKIAGLVRDTVIAAEIVRAAKALGRSVSVGEKGIAVEVMS